jgi:hypothetical protein
MGVSYFPNGISTPFVEGGGGFKWDGSGTAYYVDNNYGNDGNVGDGWERPLKTLARAVVLSNLDIARGSDRWARRNAIFYVADYETATITTFPNKCDVIGCGSYDANDKAGIYGHHAPTTTGNQGTRFFNIWFKSTGAAAPIITLTSASSGVQFHNCTFTTNGTTTIGIQATASPFLKVKGCRFEGAFATSNITFGTGEAGGTEIVGNTFVDSAAAGIVLGSGTTASWGMVIKENTICAGTLVIDDNSDSGTGIAYVTDNRLISLAASTTAYTENIDINLGRAAGNYLTTPNIATVYPILDTTT